MQDLSSVRDAPILEAFDESQIAALASIARQTEVRKSERLFARGEEATTFYIVKEGSFALSLQLRSLGSHQDLAVEEKGPGAALAWSALVEPNRSLYSCHCVESGSLIAFPRGDLARLLSLDRDLGNRFSINLNRLIADRLRVLQNLWVEEIEQSMARIDHWTHTAVADRLASALESPPKQPTQGRRFFRRS